MSDEPTQPSTQPVLDPRRLGRNNSGLNDEDIADVLLILHPASPTAINIVELAAETRPEHVLFRRNSLDSMSGSLLDIEEQETIIINGSRERIGHGPRAGADLALRMSSVRNLKFPQLGFIFGRNPNISDIVFGQDSAKRISNQHFRIYLNPDGILMIEDMSTNGTIVDDHVLNHKLKHFPKIRTLSSGSIISILNTNESEMIRFIVRVPARDSHNDRYLANRRNFIAECAETGNKEKALQRISKQGGGPSMKWDGGANYNIIGQIGKGAFATVYQLATKMEGKLLAAKELEKRHVMKNGQLDRKIENEMKIMQSLRHPNIVEFVEYYDQGDYLYIIMELVRYGDLQAYLHQQGPLKESVVRSIAQQILSALGYLHQSQITHRDIKPDNILIANLDPFTVKLSDFGLSKVVKHDETFLKTFCGTLLYCAPEVFPEYGTSASKGIKRRRGTKTPYHSYNSSVDIWSFGGVLWYCLCNQPPFKGISDATGEAMFNNIMETPLDPLPLQKAGVSAQCIDLLMRMLHTDPAMRPTDRECLNHPWLKEGAVIPADPTLQSIVEEDESEEAEQQLSQLKIREEILQSEEEDEISSEDELIELVQPKRIRADPRCPRDQLRDTADFSADASFQPEDSFDEDESFRLMPAPGRPRLFGEIGQSALRSSGILNVHANNALSQDESAGVISRDGFQSFSQAVGGVEFLGPFTAPAQLEGGLSSPSLLGTESLVREMNMSSPHSPVSRSHTPGPTTPRTPEVPQHKSLTNSSKEFSQISEPTPKARGPGLNRQISLPLTPSYYYDPLDPSTHNPEYASKVSGYDFLSAGRDLATGTGAYEDTVRASDTSSHSEAAASSPSAEVPCVPAELDTRRPPRCLGKLVATADSFAPNLTLNIDRSKTSWGRHVNNSIVYEDSRDTRIPKTAFIIFWYSSGGESAETVQALSQKEKDWTSLKELNVGIWTLATHGISINGKHLKHKDKKGRVLFGHLHSGDIVQVYHDPKLSEFLKFRCEFYLGEGKEARKPSESFHVMVGDQLKHE